MRSSIMATVVFFILIFVPAFLYSDEAHQTDWSGGPGFYGPVTVWGDEFYLVDDEVEWSDNAGSIVLKTPAKHIVDGNLGSPWSVYSEDIDGDGDMDVLGAIVGDDDITWWENSDTNPGIYWTEHIVDGNFDAASSVYSEDIDGDGDMDVLGASYAGDGITWWENIDGSGTYWTEHTVDEDFCYVFSIYSEDIDGDGDMDVLGAASQDDDITWWENIDGSGTYWTEHTIDGYFWYAHSVYSEDIDGDGDMDVLGAASNADDITWWENIDGLGTYWTEHTIDGNFDGAIYVYSEDIDGDGDMDVLGAAYNADDITWWENIDGSGTSWTEHTVDEDFLGVRSVYSEDMDADGDMDILGAAVGDDGINWWENYDGLGTFWIEHTVDESFRTAWSVYSEDIDGDGDMDVLGASYGKSEISWWDLDVYSPGGSLESSIFYTSNEPEWDHLEWNATTPANTSVSFQVRASDYYTDMGDWSDTLTSPCILTGILNDGDIYLQYRAILSTSDPDTTPILDDITISWDPLGVEEDPQVTEYLLFGVEPNPSSGSVSIGFAVPELSPVALYIFDLSGRLVSEIHNDEYSPGYHDVLLEELFPGLYFCSMISGDFTATQRFVVIE